MAGDLAIDPPLRKLYDISMKPRNKYYTAFVVNFTVIAVGLVLFAALLWLGDIGIDRLRLALDPVIIPLTGGTP